MFALLENADGVSYSITGFREGLSTIPEEITIPDEFNSKKITEIADNAFSNHGSIKKITFGKNIKRIGKSAFKGNKNITQLVLPEALENIDNEAFSDCSAIESIQFNGKLKTIGERSFWKCAVLSTLDMPNSLESVGTYGFCYCTNIQTINFKDNFKYLGYQAFYGCTSLNSVDLGNGELVVERYAFQGCTSLTDVTIGEGVQEFGYGVFYNDPVQFNSKDKMNYIGNDQHPYIVAVSADMDIENYTSEPETRVISDSAFFQRSQLSSVVLGDNVQCIDKYAFSECTNLTTITFGANIKKVKAYAFEDSDAIQTVNADSVLSWLNIQFLPDTSDLGQVQYKGEENPLFHGADLVVDGEVVTNVNFPDGVTSISKFAFVNYKKLEVVNIGKDVTEIGDFAFKGCSGISTFTVTDGNPVYEDGGNCIIESDSKTLILGCKMSEIPDGVKVIGDGAFKNIKFENTELTIPNTVQIIGAEAFDGDAFSKITMGTGVKSIGKKAFSLSSEIQNPEIYIEDLKSWCSIDFDGSGANPMQRGSSIFVNGTEVSGYKEPGLVIPESITEIKPWAFFGAFIINLSISKNTIKIATTSFAQISNLQSITVAEGNEIYHMTKNKKAVVDKDGTVLVGIGGNKIDFTGENIKKIGDYAFADKVVGELILPDGLESIGESAFNFARLKKVNIPDSVKEIAPHAFESNRDLTSIIIPGSVDVISDYAFNDCLSLETITINEGTTKIGEAAFRSSSLAVSENQEKLTTINLPASIVEIGDSAFYYRTLLQNVTLNDGLTKIGSSAFGSCSSLVTITIPSSVNYIGAGAFRSCSALQTVYFDDQTSSWYAAETENRQVDFSDPYDAVQELNKSSVYYWAKNA